MVGGRPRGPALRKTIRPFLNTSACDQQGQRTSVLVLNANTSAAAGDERPGTTAAGQDRRRSGFSRARACVRGLGVVKGMMVNDTVDETER